MLVLITSGTHFHHVERKLDALMRKTILFSSVTQNVCQA